ncbi:MAG: hypothetical protein EXX96DRAFT_589717 [Benjaminiella poitrasii]|nr:MAG: hypothetical protein EXX96DRAFT_589717 [Benjaminiella poitrasii]
MYLSINMASSNHLQQQQQQQQPQQHYQSKPMAISSITSATLSDSNLMATPPSDTTGSSSSSPSLSHAQHSNTLITSNTINTTTTRTSPSTNSQKSFSPPYPTSPSSPDNSHLTNNGQQSNRHFYFQRPYSTMEQRQQSTYKHQRHFQYPPTLDNRMMPYASNSTASQLLTPNSASPSFSAPLSLQERRQRNKAASAKYRAKKNQQHGEMRALISSLTKENDLLQRQLETARQENNRLKTTCDRLRGKILAEKMLKKLLNHPRQSLLMQQQQKEEAATGEDVEDEDMTEAHGQQHYYFDHQDPSGRSNTLVSLPPPFKKRYDEDIDFEDDDDKN